MSDQVLLDVTIVEIPGDPPSVNRLYNYDYYRKEMSLSKDAILWKIGASSYIQKPSFNYKGRKLHVTMDVYKDWYYKNQNMARVDVKNMEKFVHDTLFKIWRLDDSFIWIATARKIQNTIWNGIKITVGALE